MYFGKLRLLKDVLQLFVSYTLNMGNFCLIMHELFKMILLVYKNLAGVIYIYNYTILEFYSEKQ